MSQVSSKELERVGESHKRFFMILGFPYELERTSSTERAEPMHHFVAENMEDKLRSASK